MENSEHEFIMKTTVSLSLICRPYVPEMSGLCHEIAVSGPAPSLQGQRKDNVFYQAFSLSIVKSE